MGPSLPWLRRWSLFSFSWPSVGVGLGEPLFPGVGWLDPEAVGFGVGDEEPEAVGSPLGLCEAPGDGESEAPGLGV